MSPAVFLCLLLSTAAVTLDTAVQKQEKGTTLDVSDVIEEANAHIKDSLVHGDIIPSLGRNADPCTSKGCLWPKRGRYVYVPVILARSYNKAQRKIIIRSLITFHRSTCIRFVRRRRWHDNYLFFFSGSGCWSYLGRQRRGQRISLRKNGCLDLGTVQHEVLHALGFHHEQVRSDRDTYVQIMTQNIQPGTENNFQKVDTNNLNTRYDFNSVMHYSKYAFSKNNLPTIIAKSDPDLDFGRATEMSQNDIARVNRLYQCQE